MVEAFPTPTDQLEVERLLYREAYCLDTRDWPLIITGAEDWYVKPDAGLLLGSPENPLAISAAERQGLGDNLAQCLVGGLIEARSAPDSFVTTISERPCASAVARIQARSAPRVSLKYKARPIAVTSEAQASSTR